MAAQNQQQSVTVMYQLIRHLTLLSLLCSVTVFADELKSVSPTYQQPPVQSLPQKQLPSTIMQNQNIPPVESIAPQQKPHYQAPKNVFHFSGFVIYIDQLEGGFYGILSNRGEKYLPLNLNEKHRQSGLEVEVMAQLVEKEMTNKMWGNYIRLISIKPRNAQQ